MVVDAGANIGIFTAIASLLVGKNGKVIAIEPDPDNLRILEKNVKLNRIENGLIVQKALYSETGKLLNFFQNGVMSKIVDNEKENTGIMVESIKLDDVVKKFCLKPTILKMDIEGAEKFALLGMKETMKTIKHLEGEIHSQIDYDTLMTYSNSMAFTIEPAERLSEAFKFF